MTLSFKGIEVFYTRRGKGKTLLLLHGFLENQHMWNELTPSLSETHTVISIDLLGHGQTECYGYIHTMEDMAEFVHAVLEHENIQGVGCNRALDGRVCRFSTCRTKP